MTAPIPHDALLIFKPSGDSAAQKRTRKVRATGYVLSLCAHVLGLAVMLAAPLIKEGYPQEKTSVASRHEHVILYYQPPRVRPSPLVTLPTPVARRLTPKIVAPVPVLVKPTVLVPPAPSLAAAIVERPPDIPHAPLADVRPPEKHLAEAAKPAPVQAVKVGAFGDPDGAPARQPSVQPLVTKVGSFDAPPGPGAGRASGNGRSGNIQTGVFGDGASVSGSPAGGSRSVQASGFGDGRGSEAPGDPRPQLQEVASTPLQILSHPKPTYSQEARDRRIEGVVDLEVLFHANGEIQVLRVVHSLGYGLDDAAKQVASQIRFRPGTRGGVPVDSKTIVHVTFELT